MSTVTTTAAGSSASLPVVLDGLRRWARGAYAEEAAVELLARAFGGRFCSPSWPWVEPCDRPGWYWLDGEALLHGTGALSGGEQRLLAVVGALASGSALSDLPGLRFLLGTGCRIGEALALTWPNVDLERHVITISGTLIRVKGQGLMMKRPKTKAGFRVLRVPLWLVAILRERRARDPESEGAVFPDSIGGHRDPNNVERDHRKVRAGTPFEWVVPHTYRKTVATMLDQQGLSARTIADQLGHARISMTQDVYMGRRVVDQAAATALEHLSERDRGEDDDPPAALSVVV